MGDYIVRVRFGNEEHRVTEFITPWHHQVQELTRQVGYDVEACYNWVCRNVKYPMESDRHHISAFGGPFPLGFPVIRLTTYDFWQFPYETIGWMKDGYAVEDCDGSAILLCSMLRCFVPANEVYVGIGGYSEIDHAWVRIMHDGEWHVLESTLDEPFPPWAIIEASPYNPYCYFNDREAVELVPGSFNYINTRSKDNSIFDALSGLLGLAKAR